MTRSGLLALACALAAHFAFVATAVAQGQPGAPAPGAPTSAAGGPPPGSGGPPPGGPPGGPGGGGGDEGKSHPIVFVTSVEVLSSERSGGIDIVRARGLVTSSGWGGPHLLPITQGKPADGVLDLIFQAHAPAGASPPGQFMVVEALLPISPGHPFKGVRVRSGFNAVSLKSMPGFAEAAAPKEDCAKCVGKFFQAKGAAAPGGAAAADIVRQEDLPYELRVIKPTDGIAHYDLDPNRLTLILSEDGRIVDAAWD